MEHEPADTPSSPPSPERRCPLHGRQRILLVVLVAMWCVLAWGIVRVVDHNRLAAEVAREHDLAQQEAFSAAAHLGRSLAYLRNVPTVIAHDPEVLTVLKRFGPAAGTPPLPEARRRAQWLGDPALAQLSGRLESLVRDVGVDHIWVLDAAGDGIAAGGFTAKNTVVGANLATRDYFRTARAGQRGHQFAIGHTTGIPGLYFSVPVQIDNQFVGAIAVAINISQMELGNDVLVADTNGVVVLAQDPKLILRTMPGSPLALLPEADVADRYGRTRLSAVDLAPWPTAGIGSLVRFDGSPLPWVMESVTGIEDIVSIHVLRPVAGIAAIHKEDRWLLVLLILVGIVLVAAHGVVLAYVNRRVQYTRKLQDLNRRLAQQADTDALTGCANRRRLMEAIEAERYRARRYGEIFSVAMVDIDHFKAINDLFGHASGDLALRGFADQASRQLRPSDLLGRLGGEEFALLLPRTAIAGALATAERIRAAIETQTLRHNDQPITFTVSAGVAEWRPDTDESAASLLERADAALYLAKNGGRNQVRRSPSIPPMSDQAPPLAG